MDHNRENLSGVFAPVVTPFDGDEPDLEALTFNLKRLRSTNLTGFLALGSNGEVKSLTDKEQLLVLEVISREKGDKVVMVGTGCESTAETIEKSQVAVEMGFHYVSILPPHYFAKHMSGSELQQHYKRIAEKVTVPVLLYNAPQFAGGLQIPPKTIVELSQHPNIVGIKDSSAAGPTKLLASIDPTNDFYVLSGSLNTFYPSLHAGATGGVLSLANVLPERCTELYDLFMQAMYERARELSAGLIRLNQAVSGTWGVAGVKVAIDLVGLKGGRPREPLLPTPSEAAARIKEAMVREGFLTSSPLG
jgi:4-hydroxy-2-oxoglutarate aldolase